MMSVHAITVLLMLTLMQYAQSSRNCTQRWCKQNPMNLYKCVAIRCNNANIASSCGADSELFENFKLCNFSDAGKTWPYFETVIEVGIYFM